MQRSRTQTTDSDGDTQTHHHYAVDYGFEAVRSDGMRCRVNVENRDQPKRVWDSLAVGSQTSVSYVEKSPEYCRLTASAEVDQAWGMFVFQMLFGSIFLGASIFVGVVVPFTSCGFVYGFYCFIIWGGLLTCCFCNCLLPMIGNSFGPAGTIKELRQQEAACHLGDITGEWTHRAGEQRFVYKLKKGATIGRQEDKSEWDPAVLGHWRNETELTWQDEFGSIFTATFTGCDNFEGVAKSGAPGGKAEVLSFKGYRINEPIANPCD